MTGGRVKRTQIFSIRLSASAEQFVKLRGKCHFDFFPNEEIVNQIFLTGIAVVQRERESSRLIRLQHAVVDHSSTVIEERHRLTSQGVLLVSR